jgi:hypothetical protein
MVRHHHLVSGRNLTGFARKLTTTVVEYFISYDVFVRMTFWSQLPFWNS